jgi:hypothetical protein
MIESFKDLKKFKRYFQKTLTVSKSIKVTGNF